ncbi:6-bladed beta-propeller [Marivirga arenosa]|uniref:6-bladed beta-propeller n=1 Tax=Marivirga arenosa TaxID=3059076 RepID=A0AA49GH24_9BACT|nr:6-bladed beta-propeller [Marivirga sp. ABR2-2]WKK86704.2 6-bladed beta-propeller [Marivirga sp. ABR2-2]
MKVIKIISLLSIVIFQSCNTPEKNYSKEIRINLNDKKTIQYGDYFELNKIVTLDSEEIISNIQSVGQLRDNLIVHCRKPSNLILIKNLKNNKEVLINKIGEGPDEYLNITNFSVSKSGETFFILDNKKGRITEVDTLGNIKKIFKNELLNSTYSFTHLKGEIFALHGGNFYYGTLGHQLAIFDFEKDKLLEKFLPIPENQRELLFMERNNFTRNEGFYHNMLISKLFQLTDKSIAAEYSVHFENQNMPESFLNQNFDGLMDFVKTLNKSNYPFKLTDYNVSEKFIYFTFKYKGELYHTLFDRNTEENITFDHLSNNLYGFSNEKVKADFNKVPLGIFYNSIVFQVDPFEEIEKMKQIKGKLNDSEWETYVISNKKWFELFDNVNQNSNPILVLLNYKG